jgi:hypothetical protein
LSEGLGRPDWYAFIAWDAPEADAVDRAKDQLINRGKVVSPGGIVSELTLGFWVQLTAKKYEKVLWVPYLHKAFPKINTNRKGLNKRLHRLLYLRNRIAHHERISHFSLQTEYAQVIEAVHWTCPITATWVDGTNRLKKQLWPRK